MVVLKVVADSDNIRENRTKLGSNLWIYLVAEQRSDYLLFFDLIRMYQRRSSFVATAFETPLTLAQGQILVEIAANPSVSSTDLVERLGIDKSTLSRYISQMKRKRYIGTERQANDRRVKRLVILSRGEQLLNEYDAYADERVRFFIDHLTVTEHSLLRNAWKLIADARGAAPVALRPGEHPFLVEDRRYMRSFGYLSTSLLDSGFDATEWQVFSEIAYGGAEVTGADIARALDLSPTTVASITSRMEDRALISKVQSQRDGRKVYLRLLPDGRRGMRKIENTAERIIAKAFSCYTKKEREEVVQIMAKFVGVQVVKGAIHSRSLGTVRLLSSEQDLKRARAFAIFNLVRSNQHLDAPETLLGRDNHCFALETDGGLTGVCEFSKEGKRFVLNTLLSSEAEFGEQSSYLLREASFELIREEGVSSVYIPKESLAAGIAKKLGGKAIANYVALSR